MSLYCLAGTLKTFSTCTCILSCFVTEYFAHHGRSRCEELNQAHAAQARFIAEQQQQVAMLTEQLTWLQTRAQASPATVLLSPSWFHCSSLEQRSSPVILPAVGYLCCSALSTSQVKKGFRIEPGSCSSSPANEYCARLATAIWK